MTELKLLEPLAEDWASGLVVVAHPDDMEYGDAASVARWVGQGKHFAYCLVTSGEAGIESLPPEECGPLREREQRAACDAVGVSDVTFLGYPDGMVEYGLTLRRALARQVRLHRPDVLITVNFRDTWDGTALNQADHIAVGRALLDAARDAANPWVFRDLMDGGVQPWKGVRAVWAAGSPDAGHGVDVTMTFQQGLASLQAHQAYLTGLGQDASDAAGFLEGYARGYGTRLGCELAIGFEVFRL